MSKQIAVRLPDDVVAYLDGLVAAGAVESRAAAVEIALERDRRQRLADADILAIQRARHDDLDDLAEHAAELVESTD